MLGVLGELVDEGVQEAEEVPLVAMALPVEVLAVLREGTMLQEVLPPMATALLVVAVEVEVSQLTLVMEHLVEARREAIREARRKAMEAKEAREEREANEAREAR